MNSKLLWVAVVVVAIIAAGAYLYPKVQVTYGANPGPDHYEAQFFHNGLTYGEGVFATSTTGTLTVAQFTNYSVFRNAPTGAGQAVVSWTLPASTTMAAIIPNAGNCRDWIIDNSGVAAATTTTIVAGTGIDLVGMDATGAGAGADVIDGLEWGKLTLCRQNNTDIVGFVSEWLAAD